MTDILFISVSTPAVRQIVDYARRMMKDCEDVRFHIYYLCGENAGTKINIGKLKADIRSSDFQVVDLMGADGRVVGAITSDLTMSGAQRIVISRRGPVGHRLGGFDTEKSLMNAADAKNVELFSEYFRRCNQGDIANAIVPA